MLTMKRHAGYAPAGTALHLAPQAGRSFSRLVRVLGLVVLGVGDVVSGQTVWTGTTGSWLTAGNWDNGVPSAGTNATINNGGTVTLAGTGVVNLLTVGTSATGGTLTISSGMLTSSDAVIAKGKLSTGAISVTGGSWVINNSLQIATTEVDPIAGSGQLTISGSGLVSVPVVDLGTGVLGGSSSLSDLGGYLA